MTRPPGCCEVCRVIDDDVQELVLGGVMPGSMPLHAHSLHRACASRLNRSACESCCSVIVSASGGLGTGRHA